MHFYEMIGRQLSDELTEKGIRHIMHVNAGYVYIQTRVAERVDALQLNVSRHSIPLSSAGRGYSGYSTQYAGMIFVYDDFILISSFKLELVDPASLDKFWEIVNRWHPSK